MKFKERKMHVHRVAVRLGNGRWRVEWFAGEIAGLVRVLVLVADRDVKTKNDKNDKKKDKT